MLTDHLESVTGHLNAVAHLVNSIFAFAFQVRLYRSIHTLLRFNQIHCARSVAKQVKFTQRDEVVAWRRGERKLTG